MVTLLRKRKNFMRISLIHLVLKPAKRSRPEMLRASCEDVDYLALQILFMTRLLLMIKLV